MADGCLREARVRLVDGHRSAPTVQWLPDFLRRSGTIEGFAFLDPGMLGVRGAGTQPLGGLVITSLINRLRRRGEAAFSVVVPTLTLVYIGPFPTRQHALAARQRLRLAGIDGFVTKR